jgi:hypothetical protein
MFVAVQAALVLKHNWVRLVVLCCPGADKLISNLIVVSLWFSHQILHLFRYLSFV